MKTAARILLLTGLALLGWHGLESWIPQASERFYVIVPPLALAAWLLFARPTSSEIRVKCRASLPFVGGMLLFAMGYAVLCAGALSLLHRRVWQEIAIMTYFLLAVAIVAISTYRVLQAGLGRLGERFHHGAWRMGVGQVLPGVLFLLAVLPYLLALTYVHRFKVPHLQDPAEITGRAAEAVAFHTRDGVAIRGWFIPAATASERTVIICHGLGGNCTQFVGLLAVADRLGANALLFDFRGHGHSDGHTVTMGHFEKHDVIAAVDYLRERRPGQARQIVGMAISMGASALVLGAAELETPLDLVLLDSGFASAVDLTDNVLGFVPASVRPWLTAAGIPLASLHAGCSLAGVAPEECIGRVRSPVLMTHFQRDPLIPITHASRLFARAAQPKQLLVAPHDGHGGAMFLIGPAYFDAAKDLLPKN